VQLAASGNPLRGPLLCQLIEADPPSHSPSGPAVAPGSLLQAVGDSLASGFVFQLLAQRSGRELTNLRFGYLGAAAPTLRADAGLLLQQLEPGERQRLLDALSSPPPAQTPLDLQLHYPAPSGGSRWLHLRAIAQPPLGDCLRWEGVVQDITERDVPGALVRR
jgi:hypothetical protein